MRFVRIPRTCSRRNELTYALLIARVYHHRTLGNAFEGKRLKTGASVQEDQLWPAEDYPETPLLLEYAGSDHSGRGHRRSNQIYLLWRYDRHSGQWREVMRVMSQGREWIDMLKPVALLELAPAPRCALELAISATRRVL